MRNQTKDVEYGGYYCRYASGDGAISFVHCNHRGNADGLPVPENIARELMPNDYVLHKINGHWKAKRL